MLLSVAGAAMITAGVVGGVALRRDHELASGCGETGTCQRDDVLRVDRLARAADGLAISGAALAVGAGLGFLLRKPPPVSVQPRVTRNTAFVSAGVAF